MTLASTRRVSGRLVPSLDRFRSKLDVGRFDKSPQPAGLGVRGLRQAGGSIFDDFNNDGSPDLLVSSIDAQGSALRYHDGHGAFEDRSSWSNLGDQIFVLDVAHADFDNDGNLDVLLMRSALGAASTALAAAEQGRRGLQDVTVAAGLAEPIRSIGGLG